MSVPGESLTDTERRVVATLMEFGEPASGRRVAAALRISPTTATSALGHLRELGLVESRAAGRAVLWTIREGAPSVMRLFGYRRGGSSLPSQAQGPAPADAERWVSVGSGDADRSTLTAVVFTAIPLEYEAVRGQLGSCSRARSPHGTRFEVGPIRGDRADWDVYLAEIGMGNAASAAEVTAAAAFDPALVLFVGVAGGLKPDDQARGDVVIAERVYNVHSGKYAVGPDGASEVLSRPVSLPTSYRLTQLVREVARSPWQPQALSTAGRAAQAHLKPIVAGEVVLADPDSELRRRIAERFNDAGAVDMESYGVYEAAHRMETPVLAIRGLSDLIGDKRAAEDHHWQPRAAANAAAFAVALLRHADDDDFPPGRHIPPRPPGGTRQVAASEAEQQASEEALDRLAPNLRPWWRRLRLSSPARAGSALADLAAHSESPIGWLGRTRHRPLPWLREDDNGDAWALLARFAASHSSSHATYAYERAAELAANAGWDTIAALHRLAAAVSRAEDPNADAAGGDAQDAGRAEVLRRLRAEQTTAVGPLAAFLCAAVENDRDGTLSAAGPALRVLGLDSVSLGLPPTTTGIDDASEAALAELVETDPDVVAELRSQILLTIANLRLMDDDTGPALRILALAREIVPAATTPLLLTARAHLQRVAGPTSQRSNVDDTAAVLADVEQLALLARDRRRDWNGPTAEALALAGRARAQSGDFEGALRLLLPPPRGHATDREAADPTVRAIASEAATFAGEPLLAAELATGVTDPVERHLLRAVALSRAEGMGDEAERSYRAALEGVPDTRPDQLVRALLGMARLGVPIAADAEGNIADALARLRSVDPEAADLVEASAALHAGRPRDALVLARRYPESVAAMELAAEAAAAAGQPEEAIRVLERVGRQRGDNTLLVQAMQLAAEAGRREDAERLSTTLLTAPDPTTRRQALQTKLQAAGREGRWQDVADLSRRLLDDEDLEPANVNRAVRDSYRWALALAEFNLGRPERALTALQAPDPVVPRSREEARLLLAVLHTTAAAPSRLAPQDVVARALDVAAEWPGDEEIMAACLGLAMMTAADIPLPDQLLVPLRTLQEDYFTRFPDSKTLQRIEVGEDLDGLVQHMKETMAPETEALQDLARRVWLGVYPLAFFTDVTRHSYAETLIKRALGCRVIAGDPGVADQQRTAARDALAGGSVVTDTSALHLLGHAGVEDTRLTAQFARIILPASLRDDVLRANAGLAVRSIGTLWWDSAQQRPALTEVPLKVADGWAVEAQTLVDRLALVDVVADPVGRPERIFDTALLLAKDLHIPLWADDLALRQVAGSTGVRAFGTLDLIGVLVESGALTVEDEKRALDLLAKEGAVDLPVLDRLVEFARDAGWKPDGYAALLLARPRSWIPPEAGFARYKALIEALPQDTDDTSFAQWGEAAATGLAWASPPPARPRVIATLLAWMVLNKPTGAILPALLDAGQRVQKAAAPDGDVLPHLIAILAETISKVEGTANTGIVMTRLLGSLDDKRRTAAMRLFLSPPREPT